jgi:hypothetical protein
VADRTLDGPASDEEALLAVGVIADAVTVFREVVFEFVDRGVMCGVRGHATFEAEGFQNKVHSVQLEALELEFTPMLGVVGALSFENGGRLRDVLIDMEPVQDLDTILKEFREEIPDPRRAVCDADDRQQGCSEDVGLVTDELLEILWGTTHAENALLHEDMASAAGSE